MQWKIAAMRKMQATSWVGTETKVTKFACSNVGGAQKQTAVLVGAQCSSALSARSAAAMLALPLQRLLLHAFDTRLRLARA